MLKSFSELARLFATERSKNKTVLRTRKTRLAILRKQRYKILTKVVDFRIILINFECLKQGNGQRGDATHQRSMRWRRKVEQGEQSPFFFSKRKKAVSFGRFIPPTPLRGEIGFLEHFWAQNSRIFCLTFQSLGMLINPLFACFSASKKKTNGENSLFIFIVFELLNYFAFTITYSIFAFGCGIFWKRNN